MDPLSDVLSLLRPRGHLAGSVDASGEWSLTFPAHEGIRCYAVVHGKCRLIVDGAQEPLRLESGDFVLLSANTNAFRIASDPSVRSVDAKAVLATARDGIATINAGGEFFGVGIAFTMTGNASILLEVLPAVIHLRNESPHAMLRWSMDRLLQELRADQPGSVLVAQHLTQMILIEALRAQLVNGASGGGVGWLFALADEDIGAAIRSMHHDPAHRWTLQELAASVGMSRSTFALRFKEMVGSAPMDYLARWRMLSAGDRLLNTSDSVSNIALSLGYESESAFSTAFKRIMGSSPRQYAFRQNAASPQRRKADAARAG